jgi:hypothetical protein
MLSGVTTQMFAHDLSGVSGVSQVSLDSFLGSHEGLDDVSVDRIVDVLRSNARQWSFVESQLMEPTVNLHMVGQSSGYYTCSDASHATDATV